MINNDSATRETNSNDSDSIPLLEWVVSGLGLLLVAASLAFLFYKVLFVEPQPPRFESTVLDVVESNDVYLIRIEIHNRGGQTVADLTVRGEMKDGSGKITNQEATIDYLPGHSSRELGMLFPASPRDQPLEISFVSFQVP